MGLAGRAPEARRQTCAGRLPNGPNFP